MGAIQVLERLVEVSGSGLIAISDEKRRAVGQFQSCRTAGKGCRIVHCRQCDTSMVLYNPCNKRGCPKCHRKNQLRWLDKARARILPTGHEHLVFSIPGCYTQRWLADPRSVIAGLFASVNAVIKQLESLSGLTLAWMLVFQSHGKGMSYKPHIHCLLADGGLDANGEWKPLGVLPIQKMTRLLAEEYSESMELFEKPENKGWSVYAARHESTGEKVIGYLAHTMVGVVMSVEQELEVDHEHHRISFQDSHGGSIQKTTLDETVFVERYLMHIPPERAVTVRSFGLYSNRHSDDLEEIRRNMREHNPMDEEATQPLDYGELCPCCHAPMYEILAAGPGEAVNYQKYGFNHGPPEHGAYTTRTDEAK